MKRLHPPVYLKLAIYQRAIYELQNQVRVNCDKNVQNTWNFAKMKNDTFEIKNFCINCDEFLKNYLKPNAPQTF